MEKKQILQKIFVLLLSTTYLLSFNYGVIAEDANHEEIGIWFVTDYDHSGLDDIPGADDEADEFYDTLYNGGATKSMRHGDNNANESHWEKSSVGGSDSSYVETIDYAWFTGHGNSGFFTFNTDTDGDSSYVNRTWYHETQWGNDDLEWVFLHSCSCLYESDISNWNSTFYKLHGICGFHTSASASTTGSTGEAVADYLRTEGYTVGEAWEQGTKDAQASTKDGAIYTAVIRPEEEEEIDYYDEPFGTTWGDYYEPYIELVGRAYRKWDC